MGDFDDGMEMGLWGADGIPYWDGDEDDSYQKKEKKRKIVEPDMNSKKYNTVECDSKYVCLKVMLTPSSLLNARERYTRSDLYKEQDTEIKLELIHDKGNEADSKALEVYYDQIFMGHIRKKFKDADINNTNVVNDFCFEDNKLRDISLFWNGEEFYLRKKSKETVQKEFLYKQKLIREKEEREEEKKRKKEKENRKKAEKKKRKKEEDERKEEDEKRRREKEKKRREEERRVAEERRSEIKREEEKHIQEEAKKKGISVDKYLWRKKIIFIIKSKTIFIIKFFLYSAAIIFSLMIESVLLYEVVQKNISIPGVLWVGLFIAFISPPILFLWLKSRFKIRINRLLFWIIGLIVMSFSILIYASKTQTINQENKIDNLKSYKKKCTQGNIEACEEEALLYSKSCENNNALGCRNLGKMFEYGKGVTRSPVRALKYYEKACTLNDTAGCNKVKALSKN